MAEVIMAIVMNLTLAMTGANEATLLFAGDAMMHQAQLDAAKALGHGRSYDYSDCFTPVSRMISDADYAVVNLETPLGYGGFTGYPCFCAPTAYAEALRKAGFDLFLTANNHTLDRRDKGLKLTVHLLDSLGIPHIGTYTSADERRKRLPKIVDVNGFRIAMLNYTYGTNGFEVRSDAVVDYIDKAQIKADIDSARAAGAELVCAAMHWGLEYKLLPSDPQKRLASWLIDNGVDMVIGGHPHVVQPMELRTDSTTGRRKVVVYSLGNFISNMKTRDTRGGAFAKVKLKRDSAGNALIDTAFVQLHFTVPPRGNSSRNFVVYPIDSVPAAWRGAAEAFRKALK